MNIIQDKDITLHIDRLAGIPTHDAFGNLLSSVWMVEPFKNVKSMGRLLRRADLRTLLMEQMQKHIESRQALINELSDSSVLVKWICNFTDAWEEEDKINTTTDFDISYPIQAAMHEAYMCLELHLTDIYGIESVAQWKNLLTTKLSEKNIGIADKIPSLFTNKSCAWCTDTPICTFQCAIWLEKSYNFRWFAFVPIFFRPQNSEVIFGSI